MSLPNIKLAALYPKLFDKAPYLSDARQVESLAEARGVEFDCPGCKSAGQENHRIWMAFNRWKQTGKDLGSLTFVDAVDEDNGTGGKFSTRSLRMGGYPCHCHFNITNGEIDHYGDSTSP